MIKKSILRKKLYISESLYFIRKKYNYDKIYFVRKMWYCWGKKTSVMRKQVVHLWGKRLKILRKKSWGKKSCTIMRQKKNQQITRIKL